MILFDCYYYTGWWFGTWFFPFSWEFNHPNWRTHIFQRGRYTTNHLLTSYNNYWYIVRITMFIIIITIIIVIIIPTSQKRNLPSSTWHRWGPTFSSAKGGVPGKDGRPPTKEGTIKIKKDDWWAILPSRNWWIMISLPFVKVNTWSLMWMFTRKTMMIWPPKMGVTNWWKSLMLLRWRLWSDLPQFMIKLRWRVGQRGWFLTMNGNIFVRPSHTFQIKIMATSTETKLFQLSQEWGDASISSNFRGRKYDAIHLNFRGKRRCSPIYVGVSGHQSIYYWLVVWNMFYIVFIFPFSWEFHHPNWRNPSFFRGVGWNHQPDSFRIFLPLFEDSHDEMTIAIRSLW